MKKNECNVYAVASEDYTTVSYKFSETEVGKLIQIGFIAAGETEKAEITAKANRKEWFAAENALEAALESFKANQVKPTCPETGHNVEGATYIYTSTDEANSKIANINPGWGQASAQGFEDVTVGDTIRKIIVLNLVN